MSAIPSTRNGREWACRASSIPRLSRWERIGLGMSILAAILGMSACSTPEAEATRDLLLETRDAKVLVEQELLDIGTSEARGFLRSGWSVDETVPAAAAIDSDTTFVWAVGEESEVSFSIVEPRQLRLELALRPFAYPGATPLGLALSVNGNSLGERTLPEGDHLLSFEIPEDWLVEGLNRLLLKSSRSPAASSVLPGSREPRRLTLAVFSMALHALSRPAGRATRPEGSGASGPPTEKAVDALDLAVPASVAWPLRLRAGTELEYSVDLVSGSAADVSWQWVTETEIEGLSRDRVSDSWSGSTSARGSVSMPEGLGVLRVRVTPVSEEGVTPGVRLSLASLRFPQPPKRRHLLWLTLDTFRADHLGSHGNPSIHTPHLDRLARGGLVLSDLAAHIPITGPSHSSMFTGRYPISHGVHNNGQALPLREETLGEYLKAYGWETAAVVSLVVLHSSLNFAQGFDRYLDCTGAPWWRTAPEVTDIALDLLDRQWPERPFFLWAHYSDTHEPYTPPGSKGSLLELELDGATVASYPMASGEYLRRDVRLQPGLNRLRFHVRQKEAQPFLGAIVRYLAFDSELVSHSFEDGFTGPNNNGFYRLGGEATVEVRYSGATAAEVPVALWVIEQIPIATSLERYKGEAELIDREVGKLLQGLRDRGMADDTVVVVTSDHGEGLWDHGQPGHVEQLYAEAVHSPGVLWLPSVSGGRIEPRRVQHIDLVPTLLELLELPPMPSAQGHSVLSPRPEEGVQFLQTFAPEASTDRRALVWNGWKLILTPSIGRKELFELARDPGERRDLAPSRPELVQELLERLLGLEKSATELGEPQTGPSAVDQEQLKALGYIR